jgi:hypothetical protein
MKLSTAVLPLAAAVSLAVPAEARQAKSRTIYASVVDSHGIPLKELRACDVVAEHGRERQVVAVARATQPAESHSLMCSMG